MDCPHDHEADVAERYVSGTMPEAEQAAFEVHFFECDRCFADVRTLQDVRHVLAVPARGTGGAAGHPGWTTWAFAGLAAAASIALAIVIFNGRNTAGPGGPSAIVATGPPTPTASTPPVSASQPQATPPADPVATAAAARATLLRQLAVVVAPPYVRLATRGASTPSAKPFDAAMAHYRARRFDQAATGLRALLESPDAGAVATEARFFLGISELMLGHLDAARSALELVVASGVAPYADEAHFYLAKAALAAGDVDTARRELTVAVEREAGPEGEASRLLARLIPLN